ncbi:hypothetical protein FYK55_14780 [Roseiconus nitratireducens]|uniref:Uncharacterized protein n=1 Tax=Roseiconus nitratireducens TaxID=2605748 RepID=A0A5M6D9Z1_9BACT|nr:hypothetical protein [Roseiconus nitratireducens]KAA5542779.1 hypothetical protein FYK55_14780 [Roseiconus nitratireducens]
MGWNRINPFAAHVEIQPVRSRLALAIIFLCGGGVVADRCCGQDAPPKLLRNIEKAVGAIPQAIGAPQPAAPLVIPAAPAWSIAPSETIALSVVHDMQAFSDKLDHVAKACGRPAPAILEWSISESRIRDGLDRGGSLIWMFGKPERRHDGVPIVYALPTNEYHRLIAPLDPRYRGPIAQVNAYGTTLHARATPTHALFAQPENLRWLSACARSSGGFDRRLGPLNDFLSSHDVAFALMQEGLIDQGEIRLPFSEGTTVVPPVLRRIANESFEMSGFTAIASGIELAPGTSLSAALAASIDPRSEVSRWPATMTFQPKRAMEDLPNCQPALIASFAMCDQWNEWLERLLEEQLARASRSTPDQFSEWVDFDQIRGATVLIANESNPAGDRIDQLYHLQLHVQNAHQALAGMEDCLQHLLRFYEDESPIQIVPEEREGRQFLRISVTGLETLGWQRREEPLVISASTLNATTVVVQVGEARRLSETIAEIQTGEGLEGVPGVAKSLDLVADRAQAFILVDPYSAATLLPRMGFGQEVAMTFANRFGSISSLMSMAPLIALSKDAPPLAIDAEFQPSHLVLNVAATEELVAKLGKPTQRVFPQVGRAPGTPVGTPVGTPLGSPRATGAQLIKVFSKIFFW